ncbi:MAG: sugar phosphate isomerase/epimerase [Lentisphaeria bacterium]|nr:sugar phosphate isomerase/epimerase [Lentisphaeria bacterium]
MARVPIGLEMYSVRNEFAEKPLETLQAVANMGYAGVEFAGARNHTAEEYKEMLDQTGLVCCGWHTPFPLVRDDELEETIRFNRIVGNKHVIVPGIPGNLRETREDWLKMAGFFDELAAKLAPHGMKTGYHNHNIEFAELGGEKPWDTFFGNTGPEVIMQLDMGNALSGGADVIQLLKTYTGRCQTVHLKPYSVTLGTEDPKAGFRPIIGEDDVPWNEVFELCETVGDTEWYVVEYESDAYPPMKSVELCLSALRAMGK